MSLTVAVCGVDHPHGPGHLAALGDAEMVSRVLIWDADSDRARTAAGQLARAEVIPDWEPVLGRGLADAVVVLLPTQEAGPAVLAAMEAGLYVYADKPGALTAAQMLQIVQAAERTGAHFSPCYPWRCEPLALEVKGLLERGVLGDIWAFAATWVTSQVALRGRGHWLFRREIAGGGILCWLACHWIDLLAFLLEPADSLCAMVGTLSGEPIDVEDTASVILRLPSGAIGTIRAGYAHRPFAGYEEQDLHLVFEGSLGSLFWPTAGNRGYRLRTGHPDYAGLSRRWVRVEEDPDARSGAYAPVLMRAFLRSVEDRSVPPATGRDALYVLQVLEAAYASSAQGRHVPIPQERAITACAG